MTPRLAILPDYREEGWPSMDLCSDMLLAQLPPTLAAAEFVPPYRRLFARLPAIGQRRAAFNADRVLNRHVLFPRAVRRAASRFDLFHVVDHSYAQLVHALPAEQTGVYCHDLDTFRCLLDPQREPRPRWFRALARRTLTGLQKAAIVFHNSRQTGDELRKLVDPGKLRHVPLGVAPEFQPESSDTPPAWLSQVGEGPWVAHIGSCIPRKRIDVLLDVVAALRRQSPTLKLVKVGGEWTADQSARIARLGLGDAIVHLQGLARPELAEVYRRATAVLVPSEAEGFGLPVIEALSCGAVVVASDIPALREAGGSAAVYAPVAAVPEWSKTVAGLLADPEAAPPRADRLHWASKFSWSAHANAIANAYLELLNRTRP